jgi:N utilization substance protein B
VLRPETRVRARAAQLLYAWELRGRPDLRKVAHGFHALARGRDRALDEAEALARQVVGSVYRLDAEIAEVAEHWRPERIGVMERSILRIALHELLTERVPAKVAIDEAVRLAHWFAGAKAPPFVNGVLDAVARRVGRL